MAKPGHVYHWKHGWIPITPRAAMVKAKGNRSLADKYREHYHITDNRSGGDRRQGGDLGPHERRTGDERGTFQYRPGTKTRDYPDRNPNGKGVEGPQTPGQAFKMKRAELEPHAKAGNVHAQNELDRRAAKRPFYGGQPWQKDSKPEAPKAPAEKRAVPTISPAEKSANAEAMHGTGSDQHLKALEAHNREIEKGLPAGTSISSQRSMAGVTHYHQLDGKTVGSSRKVNGKFTAESRGEYFGSYDTREEAHSVLASHAAPRQAPKAAEPKPAPKPEPARTSDAEIEAKLGGHTIRPSSTTVDGRPSMWTQYDSTGNRAGMVTTYRTRDGGSQFRATLSSSAPVKRGESHDVGVFATREEAHKALADRYAANKAAADASEARKAATRARKAGMISGQVAGPNGTRWEAHTLETDDSFSGRAAAAKAKQVYKADGHTVVIETALSAQETRGLLADTTRALEAAKPNLKGQAVKFLVPSGDRHFSSRGGGIVGAYVHVGGTTVHINPGIANGKHAAAFEAGGHRGHFMPASTNVPARVYTITHELGHVADNVHGHTRSGSGVGSSVIGAFGYGPGVAEHHRETAVLGGHASKYATANPAEGYAEAFAQWSLAGPGSHKVSDAYAAKYGWNAPVTDARTFQAIDQMRG